MFKDSILPVWDFECHKRNSLRPWKWKLSIDFRLGIHKSTLNHVGGHMSTMRRGESHVHSEPYGEPLVHTEPCGQSHVHTESYEESHVHTEPCGEPLVHSESLGESHVHHESYVCGATCPQWVIWGATCPHRVRLGSHNVHIFRLPAKGVMLLPLILTTQVTEVTLGSTSYFLDMLRAYPSEICSGCGSDRSYCGDSCFWRFLSLFTLYSCLGDGMEERYIHTHKERERWR